MLLRLIVNDKIDPNPNISYDTSEEVTILEVINNIDKYINLGEVKCEQIILYVKSITQNILKTISTIPRGVKTFSYMTHEYTNCMANVPLQDDFESLFLDLSNCKQHMIMEHIAKINRNRIPECSKKLELYVCQIHILRQLRSICHITNKLYEDTPIDFHITLKVQYLPEYFRSSIRRYLEESNIDITVL